MSDANPVVDLEAALEAIFERNDVKTADEQQLVVRRARRENLDLAAKEASLLFRQAAAIARGWKPHAEPLDWPEPAPLPVRQRVLRWARSRGSFSTRDLMRSTDWFDRAIDARECLEQLVADGRFERVPSGRKTKGPGRPPGQRYRLRAAQAPQAPNATTTDPLDGVLEEGESLDWPTSTAELLHPTQSDESGDIEHRAWPAP